MKSIAICGMLIICSVIVATAPTVFEKETMEKAVGCMKEHGLKIEDFEKLQKAEEIKPEDITDDMKCAIHCTMSKTGFMDENGKMKYDTIKTALPEEYKDKFEEAFKECNEVKAENPCETAFLTFGCMAAHKIKNFGEDD